MALIDMKELNVLRNASDVKSVALTALDDIELLSVATAINTAANSGQLSTVWNGELSQHTQDALKAKEYEIISTMKANRHSQYRISWGGK